MNDLQPANMPLEAAKAFFEAAVGYLNLIESCDKLSPNEFCHELQSKLSSLYYNAVNLPRVASTDDVDLVEPTYESWTAVFSRVQCSLGAIDLYRDIDDPSLDCDDSPSIGSLADDLADIWRDLSKSCLAWQSNQESQRTHAIWEAKFSFDTHWGKHLVDALRAIHTQCN